MALFVKASACIIISKHIALSNLDINECMTNDSNCEHTCVNTIGSYYCQCVSGFRLNATTNATCYGK